jgi:hypothetical protein
MDKPKMMTRSRRAESSILHLRSDRACALMPMASVRSRTSSRAHEISVICLYISTDILL